MMLHRNIFYMMRHVSDCEELIDNTDSDTHIHHIQIIYKPQAIFSGILRLYLIQL